MFPKAIPTSWVVRSVASADKSIENLLPFELGVFNEDTHKTLASGDVSKQRRVYLAVGSPNQRQFTQNSKPERLSNPNNADVNFRTELIPPAKVDILRYQVPKMTEKPNVYYLGYNGTLSPCQSLNFECGKTYMFHVEVKGRPVRNIFPGEMREVIEFSTDCCDNCTQTECNTGEDCYKYMDALVDSFNNSLWVSRFFKASKITKCGEDPAGLTKTNFVKYHLTVCDNGDELALSAVQNQYTSNKVTVVSRKAPYTTYEIIKTAGLPSAFTQQSVTFVNECGECPSGFTELDAGYAYIIEVGGEDGPLVTLGTIQGIWTDVTSGTKISTTSDTATWYLVSTTELTNSLVNNLKVVTSLGTVPARCQGGSTSTAWVSIETVYKVQRDLVLSIGSDNCDDPVATQAALLAEAEDFYGALAEVVADSLELGDANDPSGCVMQLKVSQYNTEYLKDDCDTSPAPRFSVLPAFKGQPWKVDICEGWTYDEDTGCPTPPVADDVCCQCGIKFETLPTTELLDKFAGYDFATYLEKEPVELVVSVYRDDDATRVCSYNSPTWLHAQRATFRQLRGDDVIKRIITDRFYNKEPWVNQTDKTNQLFLAREGVKLGVNIEDFYYAVDVYFNEDYVQNTTTSHSNRRHCVTLFVNQNDANTVTSVKQLVASAFPNAKLENWV